MKKLIGCLMVLLSISVFASPPMLYPGIVEMHIKNGSGRGEINVKNPSDKVMKYQLSVGEIGSNGKELPIKDYMQIFPKNLILKPGASQKVKVVVRNFDVEKEGEYQGSIKIKTLTSDLSRKYERREGEKKSSFDIKMDIILNATVYAYVGDLKKGVEVEDFTVVKGEDKYTISGKMKNTGNYSYVAKVLLMDEAKVVKEVYAPKMVKGYKDPIFTIDVETEIYDKLSSPEVKVIEYNTKTKEKGKVLYTLSMKKSTDNSN